MQAPPPVQIIDFNFRYHEKLEYVLQDVNFTIEKGSRVLVLGANGAGKSTLFRILAGKHMHERRQVLVMGRSAFFETPREMAYLGSDWRHSISCVRLGVRERVEALGFTPSNNVPYHGDFTVKEMLDVLGWRADKERVAELVELLEINLQWHMHQVSDGETRRVQILLALMNPFSLLLLDEITVDLDVLTRMNLLEFFKRESEKGCTIMYATHIFDGIDNWPTHFIRIEDRKVHMFPATEVIGPIYQQAALWLQEEKERRREKEKQAKLLTTDSSSTSK